MWSHIKHLGTTRKKCNIILELKEVYFVVGTRNAEILDYQ
jgi:hypothetical protein